MAKPKRLRKIQKLPLCACGCGQRVTKKGNKYILGHNKGRQATGADSDNNSAKTAKEAKSHLFQKGQSGNPKGRPRGSRNKNTVLLESILSESGECLVNKLTDMALAGNTACLKMALSRLYPAPSVPKIRLDDMPELNGLDDIPDYLKALFGKLNSGAIDVMQFDAMTRSLHRLTDSLERVDIDKRVNELLKQVDETA